MGGEEVVLYIGLEVLEDAGAIGTLGLSAGRCKARDLLEVAVVAVVLVEVVVVVMVVLGVDDEEWR